jgi:hypothetical protein
MPTCATVGLETDIKRWSDFPLAAKKLFLYDTPKKDHE